MAVATVSGTEDRWYQAEAVQSIFDYFGSGKKGNPAIGLPTAAGKGTVIARFCWEALHQYPGTRILVATHVKELVKQNASRLARMWTGAPYGICSAGLRRRDTNMPIVFGGVKTLINVIEELGHRDIMIVDECHLLSPDEATQYAKLILALLKINPYMKVVGLSATLFRAKTGRLEEDEGIITDVIYNMCTIEGFTRLIAEGYLAPAIPKRTVEAIDVSSVSVFGGEFAKKQLESAAEKRTYEALAEACTEAHDRKSWLVFASGTKHAEHCAEILNSFGISAVAVHSKISEHERDKRIAMHSSGQVTALCGMNIFTTGYDHPPLDCIIDLQPTMSVVKHVQKYGRGTRPYDWMNPNQRLQGFDYTKQNCLVLDFARNTKRLGPINDPRIPKPKEKNGAGNLPIKICDATLPNGKKCGAYNHISAVKCDMCGTEFTFETTISAEAGSDEIMAIDFPETNYFDVIVCIYTMHSKHGSPPMMRADYTCAGGNRFSEFIGFESTVPYVRHRAHTWWKLRHWSEAPTTTKEACDRMFELRQPKRIFVHTNKRPYPEILNYEF